jgi:ATP-binding cassette, subfamily B, putative efflux pump
MRGFLQQSMLQQTFSQFVTSRFANSHPAQNNFIRFLHYVKPYKYMVMAGAIGGIVKFSVPLLMPQVTRYLVDNIFLDDTLTVDTKTQQLVLMMGGMLALFLFVWAPLVFMRHYYAGKAGHTSVFDLRSSLYNHMMRMSSSFFDKNMSGSLLSRLISDIELAQNLVGSALTNVWMDFASLTLILFFLIRIDLSITLVALTTFPIYIYLFRTLKDKIRATSHKVQEEISVMAGDAHEKIAGNRIVHAFVQEKSEEKNFHNASTHLLETTMHRVRLQSINVMVTGVIVQSTPLLVLAYGGYRVISGTLSVGDLIAVTLYLTPLYQPLQRFSELNLIFANSMAAIDRVFEVMDEKPDVENRPNAVKLKSIKGEIAFKDVHFSYPQNAKPETVLRDISFTANPGEKIALVGPSGSGKSTLTSLIPRFYDTNAGCIEVDGQDVRDIKVKSLRKQIGIVLQTPILFSGTVIDNIRYGKPDATLNEIVVATKAANAYDFIKRMPKGFESEVGEGGSFLSGGQRQRITIARAFLKNPAILILDEATSSLDSESEKLIQSALDLLMEGRTTVVIAHRFSTIENADRILVMEDGRIVESGIHQELIDLGGVYQRLYGIQVQQ